MHEPKRVLILGNGFDLAHYLPTTYENFIHAMKIIESDKSEADITFDKLFEHLRDGTDLKTGKELPNSEWKNRTIEFFTRSKEIYNTETIKYTKDEILDLQEKLSKNGWYKYFKDYLDSGIETWIDFENEINYSLNNICETLTKLKIHLTLYKVEENEFLLKEEVFSDVPLMLKNFLIQLGVTPSCSFTETEEIYEDSDTELEYRYKINSKFVKQYREKILNIKFSAVFNHIENQLNEFIEIFSQYISFIEQLKPNKPLNPPKILTKELYCIYSFNYSATPKNLYQKDKIKFLHGKASKKNNIVLGIAELEDDLLKDNKAYGFVKYYQKLVKNTDYRFLSHYQPLVDAQEHHYQYSDSDPKNPPFEIYIWGHSLDSSDKDYIHEIFGINNQEYPIARLIIYYFGKPHAQLANLIAIMGKDIIESWMKDGWLEFIEVPDIYTLNTDVYSSDKLSTFSEENFNDF